MSLAVKILVPIAIALITQIAAYFINQLTEIKNFPGKLDLLVRITVWLTLGTVALEVIFATEGMTESTRNILGLTGAAMLVGLVLDGWTLVSVMLERRVQSEKPKPPLEIRERLVQVHHQAVKRRLDYAVGKQALLGAVALEPIAMPEPGWKVIKTVQGKRVQEVAQKETILETFDDEAISGRLLILGQSGLGKTTTLLKLADALLERAKTTQQIPYIFELSAWRDDQKIDDCLVRQLKLDHGIEPKMSRKWLAAGQIIPLLDGLDELGPRQQQCAEKIDEFVRDTAGQQVVLCCRAKAYEEGRLPLNTLEGALFLQPLDDGQIQQYFADLQRLDIWQAVQSKAGLKALLNETSDEQDDEGPLLRSPLFLQILAVAYQPGLEIESKADLLNAYVGGRLSLEQRQRDRSLARSQEREANWAYTQLENEPARQSTQRYLCWLARQLQKEGSTNDFLIEQMQPRLLEKIAQEWQYSLIGGLIVFLICGSLASLMTEPPYRSIYSLTAGLTFGLLFFLMNISSSISGIPSSVDTINTVETLKFSLSQFTRKELRNKLIFGLIGGLMYGLGLGLVYGLTAGLTYGLIGGLICGLAGFLITGLITGLKEEFKTREIPNQGILASAKNTLLIVVVFYLPLVFVIGLLKSLWGSEDTVREIFLSNAGSALLFGGLTLGDGLAPVEHFLLRYLLYQQGHIPYNYAEFLKYTTERRLTQQIGGRFRFIHRELLDHFAAMGTGTSDTP